MKKNKLMMTAALFVAIATFTVTSANALTTIQVQEIKKTVLSVPVPEMPAKAAELVKNAEKKDRQAVAVTAVRAVVMKHRAAAPLVISAVSKVAPDLAAAVAVAASEVATDQAPMIARAAAVAVPTRSTEISLAVSKAVPSQANTVASTLNRMNRRGSAAGENGEGTITISGEPINGDSGGAGFGRFPNTEPNVPSSEPEVLYSQPQP